MVQGGFYILIFNYQIWAPWCLQSEVCISNLLQALLLHHTPALSSSPPVFIFPSLGQTDGSVQE